jgi:hypothetical protein
MNLIVISGSWSMTRYESWGFSAVRVCVVVRMMDLCVALAMGCLIP